MSAASMPGQQEEPRSRTSQRRRATLRVISLVLWASIIGFQISRVIQDPGPSAVITTTAFVLLFAAVHAQVWLQQWAGHRNWRRMMSRLHGSTYINEMYNLPNRNYLLAELRREMPRARANGTPFSLIVVSLDTLPEVRMRRGDDFADRAVRSLADLLKRITRNSDFIAHLEDARFCVVLNECTLEQSYIYLKRVPGTVAISDGRHMLDVPIAARLHEYDMESLYATDVLREVEEAAPLKRKEVISREHRQAA